jgi:hypothetical protein
MALALSLEALSLFTNTIVPPHPHIFALGLETQCLLDFKIMRKISQTSVKFTQKSLVILLPHVSLMHQVCSPEGCILPEIGIFKMKRFLRYWFSELSYFFIKWL